MRGLVEKMVMFSLMGVLSVGSAGIYASFAEDMGLPTIDELANMVSWDSVADAVTGALGTPRDVSAAQPQTGTVNYQPRQPGTVTYPSR